MGYKRGSITTPIIANGLVLNIDAFNANCLLPYRQDDDYSSIDTIYNTVDNGNGQRSTTGSIKDNSTNGGWQGPTTSSFYFDNGDYIELNKNTTDFISSDSSFTLCAYVKLTNPDFSCNVFINDPTETNKLEFKVDNDNQLVYLMLNSTNIGSSWGSYDWNPGGNNLNTWFYFSWVFSYTSTTKSIQCYVDAYPGSSNSTTNSYTLPTSDIRIGYTPSINRKKYISNLQFYNRALTQSEISHNYNALKGRFE
jgi:hypothetical protein